MRDFLTTITTTLVREGVRLQVKWVPLMIIYGFSVETADFLVVYFSLHFMWALGSELVSPVLSDKGST